MTTQWSSYYFTQRYPLGNVPLWGFFPIPQVPQICAHTDSPLGPDSILERCEFYAAGSAAYASTSTIADMWQMESLSLIFSAEVYPNTSGGIPDPATGSNRQMVLTAAAPPRAMRGVAIATMPGSVVYSTDGYVKSEAKRGPAHYGAGATPQLRVSVLAGPQFNAPVWGTMNTSETYHLRALWKI